MVSGVDAYNYTIIQSTRSRGSERQRGSNQWIGFAGTRIGNPNAPTMTWTTTGPSPWAIDEVVRSPTYEAAGTHYRSSSRLDIFDTPRADDTARAELIANPRAMEVRVVDEFESFVMNHGRAIARVRWKSVTTMRRRADGSPDPNVQIERTVQGIDLLESSPPELDQQIADHRARFDSPGGGRPSPSGGASGGASGANPKK